MNHMLDNHFIMLFAALLLLTFSLIKQNSLTQVTAVSIIGYETFKLKFSSEDLHFVHLSTDLLLVGLTAGATHLFKPWYLKSITFILGFSVLFFLHSTVFNCAFDFGFFQRLCAIF